MSIFENQNLERLFGPNQTVEVTNGTVQFHNNPMLCRKFIRQFVDRANVKDFQEEDVSDSSNGHKAICMRQTDRQTDRQH